MRGTRFAVLLIVASCAFLSAAASTTASSGGLKILVTGNCVDEAVTPLATVLKAEPGVATVTTFDTSTGTPTAATLKAQNIVVSLGDDCEPYADQATWGDELADYVDGGGVVLQAAYDNWNAACCGGDASPTGRFASGGYAPFELGPNDNQSTTLGQVLKPNSPIVKGLDTFATTDNTTDALASGATLLAKWADGRNAIAVKGRVVSTTASADDATARTDIARLALNTAKAFGVPNTKISKATINSKSRQASFKFAAVGTASGFRCALKPAKSKKLHFKSCHSPKTYKGLKPGKYTFEVSAKGAGGPDPTPAKKSFTIKP
jgi:hypothetical protein